MASCNHNICPPNACTLTNAIKDYKKARSGINDASLKPFLKIIESLQAEIACGGGGGGNCDSGIYKEFSTPSTIWNFDHNLSSAIVIIQVYDNDFNQLIPTTIELVNSNLALIKFSTNVSGYAIAVKACGNGSSGTSGQTYGTSGSSGSIGTSGTGGSSGTSGTVGSSGSTGSAGTAGTGGSSGTSFGTSGTSGSSGIIGSSGSSGTSGTS